MPSRHVFTGITLVIVVLSAGCSDERQQAGVRGDTSPRTPQASRTRDPLDDEAYSKAMEFFSAVWTRCESDTYVAHFQYPEKYLQLRSVEIVPATNNATEADRLNSIEWSGRFEIKFSAKREQPLKTGEWSKWSSPDTGVLSQQWVIQIQKENGQWAYTGQYQNGGRFLHPLELGHYRKVSCELVASSGATTQSAREAVEARAATQPARGATSAPSSSADEFVSGVWNAAMSADVEQARVLIASAGDVNVAGTGGLTALHWVCGLQGNEPVVQVARMLLDAGANPNAVEAQVAQTPFHAAVIAASPSLVNLLLEHGADPKRTFSDDTTALHLICRGKARDDVLQVAEMLLKAGGDVNAVDRSGQSALVIAVLQRNAALARLLLANGADPDFKGKDGTRKSPRELAARDKELIKAFDDAAK